MMRFALAGALAVNAVVQTGAASPHNHPGSSQAAAQSAPAASATLADVQFMAGHWIGGEPGDLSEEVWTEAQGDCMLGMWRYVAGGKLRVAELLTLKAEVGRVVLRLRHFDPQLVAREEKATPLVLALARHAPNEARFEGPGVSDDGLVVLTYRRPTPDTLEVALERGGKIEKYNFKRQSGAR